MSPEILTAPTVKRGTWADPAMHPFAVARLDRVTIGKFALDHDKQTARLVATGCAEISGSGEWTGVHASIEPFAERYHPLALPGLTLRLQGYPFNGQSVYTVISEQSRD